MIRMLKEIVLAEDWTAGKQLGAVFLVLLASLPLILVYVFKSELIMFLKSVLS